MGLVAAGLSKSYGTLRANDGVDLTLVAGQVHALLGENGAGKSTLVGILNGRVVPDAGNVLLDGALVDPGQPGRAGELGIATVHQDLALVPSMTGLENIALALGFAADRALRARVEAAERRLGLSVRLDQRVAELELPQRQRIELLRALSQEPAVLILDEPTTFLPPTAVEPFLRRVRELADDGLAVLLVTHRLDEARAVADAVTVMRAGRIVARYDRVSLPPNEALALDIVGERVVEPTSIANQSTRDVLRVSDLATRHEDHAVVDGVSLVLREGEILGIAGVDGNGQLELLETLAGLRRADRGSVEVGGVDVTRWSYGRRARADIQFVSGERRRDGIVPTFTVREHFALTRRRGTGEPLETILAAHRVNPPRPDIVAERLSGGNQQKMILGRALQKRSKVLLLAYPTQGLDVLASAQLRGLLVERASGGLAIAIASGDLDELLSICHRVVVMNRGRVIGEQTAAEFDRSQLGAWFTTSDPRVAT
jgi:simple sugar transport system ATP-binding protein